MGFGEEGLACGFEVGESGLSIPFERGMVLIRLWVVKFRLLDELVHGSLVPKGVHRGSFVFGSVRDVRAVLNTWV